MANDTKITLVLELPGAVSRITGYQTVHYELTALDLFPEQFKSKKDKKSKNARRIIKKGKYKSPIIETIPAKKHLNLTRVAYDYMISQECPLWYSSNLKFRERDWKKLTPKERLELHMKNIAKCEGATRYEYTVLED